MNEWWKSWWKTVLSVYVIASGSLIGFFLILIVTSPYDLRVHSDGFPAMVAIFVGAFLVVMLVGVALVRNSRPYSTSHAGRLIAWLGIVLILGSLIALVALCRVTVFEAKPQLEEVETKTPLKGVEAKPLLKEDEAKTPPEKSKI